MPGYSIQWTGKDKVASGQENDIAKQAREEIELLQKAELTASLRGSDVLLPSKPPVFFEKNASDEPALIIEECDVIVQKSGSEIKVKVTEINPVTVKYRNCDEPSGQELSIRKSEVLRVKYSNGTEEIFPDVPETQIKAAVKPISNVERKVRRMSKLSILFGVLSFIPLYGIVLGVLAIVFGSMAMHKNKENGINNPDYKKKATIGLLLGVGGILVSIGFGIWLIMDLL
ncbi:MAG: hypothetical protein WAQ28_19410 [Bacteroidia bacterium]